MKSSTARCHFFWLGCLFVTMICGLARADGPGEITGVRLGPDGKSIVIEANGKVGKHQARVIGRPNRLLVDFRDMGVAKVPPRVAAGKNDIHEIRVGNSGSKVRIVVDFQDRPVPAFNVIREEKRVVVAFGKSITSAESPQEPEHGSEPSKKKADAPLLESISFPASAQPPGVPATAKKTPDAWQSEAKSSEGEAKKKLNLNETKLAQATVQKSPPPRPERKGIPDAPPASARPGGDAVSSQVGPPPSQMVREVRPPVTPPTPDPRLLVQEITELRFFQVGHNARLMIRGGDHLDYRMNKVSPTKMRLDLANAEIPKAYQKPLRTDQFSTSVEMIVPGSQTIFIQLKDAVPYQVEKQKGILMFDFPAPRFAMTGDLKGTGGPGAGAGQPSDVEGGRIIRQEQIRVRMEELNKEMRSLSESSNDLQKQRIEVLKSYQITADPEIFAKPVTMDFQGLSLKNAFRLLAEQAGVNIIVDPDITGTTTLRLFEVPLGQVLDTIMSTSGLDRAMMRNVLRVGKVDAIKKFKDDRQKEFDQRTKELDKVMKKNDTDRREIANQLAKLQKQLEAIEKEPAPVAEDTKTEDVGEAGCIDVEGETVCFTFTTVRVTYAKARDIVRVLDCMFRLNCPGGRRVRGSQIDVAVEGVERGAALGQAQALGLAGFSEQLQQQGFRADSPGFRDRIQTQQTVNAQVTQGQAQQTIGAAAGIAGITGQAGAARGARVELPFGEDPKLARIIAYGMMWSDDTNRLIFIKDTPERIAQMKKMILTLDVPIPQVLMEARLVQADRAWGRSLGVTWGGRNDQSGLYTSFKKGLWGTAGITGTANSPTTGIAAPPQPEGTLIPSQFSVNLPAPAVPNLDSLMGLGMQFGLIGTNYITDLDLRISLGEANNMAKVISRPKVQVIDGQAASIKTGQTIAYSTISANGTQTQLVNVDLLLNVTPTIYADGRIRMVIKVTDDDVGPIVNAQASILTREATTVMIVKDGETAVIGGILRKTENERRQGWPGLMNVPLINVFFSATNRDRRIQELLVFITPTIIRRPPPAA